MGNKYLLPALSRAAEPGTETCWENREDAYDFLIDHLELEYESTESVFDGGSNAVPHLFEQMIIFTEAFFDENSPEHERAKMEWKAILAIMALKRIKHIRLQVLKVDLSGSTGNPFLKAASAFRPESEPTLYETTWDFTYILILDGNPIALFSPMTIVCPAKMFKERIDLLRQWLWFDKINGIESLNFWFGGKANEYACIGEWLKLLKAHLAPFRTDNPRTVERVSKITDVINEMLNDVSQKTAQNIQVIFQEKAYEGMNHTARIEYQFLNRCCDFHLANAAFAFLVDKFEEDIFYERLLLLKYDGRPDAMTDRDNVKRLHGLVNRVMKVNGHELISVTDSSGAEVPFFVFLPLRKSFVMELTGAGISPDDLFEKYEIVYIPEREILRITLTLKEFPYSFVKEYALQDCQMMESKFLNPVYVWPPREIQMFDWKAYYVYMHETSQEVKIEIPYQGVDERFYTLSDTRGGIAERFRIFHVVAFPKYIYITYNQVAGCLPIMPEISSCGDNGALVTVYADVGNTSTYISMIKTCRDRNSQDIMDRIPFRAPHAMWVIKNPSGKTSVERNFMEILPGEQEIQEGLNVGASSPTVHKYFRNALNDFSGCRILPDQYSVSPVQDGQIIFSENGCGEGGTVSFVGSDFAAMDEYHRRRMHIFLEQILLYAEYEAVLHGCRYAQVKFLHTYDENSEILGELKGLWDDALRKTTAKTGMTVTLESEPVVAYSEQEAMAHSMFIDLVRNGKVSSQTPALKSDVMYFGVDIGQTKTILTSFIFEKEMIYTQYMKSGFSGRRISFVDKEIPFDSYKNVLNVLLSGTYDMKKRTDSIALLNIFAQLYGEDAKDSEYYYGLYDLIAMKVEKEDFAISPDIYNRNQKFAYFIRLMTYNFMLLFLEIGIFAGKCLKGKTELPQEIDICLSGNGAKFIRWIANLKKSGQITEETCHEMFIVRMQHTILDMVRIGIEITRELPAGIDIQETESSLEKSVERKNAGDQQRAESGRPAANSESSDIRCGVRLLIEPKEYILEGAIGYDNPMIDNLAMIVSKFSFLPLASDTLQSVWEGRLCRVIESIYMEIFGGKTDMELGFMADGDRRISDGEALDLIHSRSKEICKTGTDIIDRK